MFCSVQDALGQALIFRVDFSITSRPKAWGCYMVHGSTVQSILPQFLPQIQLLHCRPHPHLRRLRHHLLLPVNGSQRQAQPSSLWRRLSLLKHLHHHRRLQQ